MTAIHAKLRYLRIAPRKVRLVADVVRKQSYDNAMRRLSFLAKRGSSPMKKLLQSAGANAKNNFNMDVENLYVKGIHVDEGPVLKRYSPRAMGRATLIRKRTSHITVILDEYKDTEKAKTKKQKSKTAAKRAPSKRKEKPEASTKPTSEKSKMQKRKSNK